MRANIIPRIVIFVICFSILLGSVILSPPTEEKPFVRLGNFGFPGVCVFRSLTGIPCPGCGLLRSMVAAANGNMANSLSYHKLGLLTLGYVLLQAVSQLVLLIFPVLSLSLARYEKYLNKGVILLAVLFGVNWIWTLSQYLQDL